MTEAGIGLSDIRVGLLDQTIYHTDVFGLAPGAFADLRRTLVDEYLAYVEATCTEYRDYLGRERHRTDSPAARFPYIPTSAFKKRDLLNGRLDVDKWCLSSGTQGARSRIGRDRTSLERLLGSVRLGLSLLDEWDEEELAVIHLGPSFENAGDVWFPYVMSLAELLYPTESFGSASTLDVKAAVGRYRELRSSGSKVAIIGAPFAVDAFCDEFRRSGAPSCAGKEVAVVTGGGWKRHAGAAIPKPEFRQMVTRTLGLENDERVRDGFNQVELNTVMFECEHHQFHVPPWVHVSVRCLETLEDLGPGRSGLLAFVDASAASYPCVIVGDDIGHIGDAPCACGRPGDLLTFERRLERGLDSGCAIALSARYGEGADE